MPMKTMMIILARHVYCPAAEQAGGGRNIIININIITITNIIITILIDMCTL